MQAVIVIDGLDLERPAWRVLSIEHRAPSTKHRAPSTKPRVLAISPCRLCIWVPVSEGIRAFTVHRSSFAVRCSSFAVRIGWDGLGTG